MHRKPVRECGSAFSAGSMQKEIDKIIDGIRERFGSDTIVRGSTMRYNKNVARKHKASEDLKNIEKK